jgi:hypothetical protein
MSKSGWETSYFGGYKRILFDYPTIKLDFNMEYDVGKQPGSEDLGYYCSGTLLKLFLLKVAEFKLVDVLSSKFEIKEKKTAFGFGKTKKFAYINQTSLDNTIDLVIIHEAELKNLFTNYKEMLRDSVFYYEIPPDKDEKSEKGGDSGGKEPDDDNGSPDNKESDKDLERKIAKMLKKALESTEIRKYFSFMSGSALSGDLKKNTKFVYRSVNSSPTKFSASEKLNAKRLVDCLDISFDPEKDVIKNLKTGKLDVNKLAEVLGGNTNLYYKVEENQTTRPFTVVILGDESGSMKAYTDGGKKTRIRQQIILVKTLYKAFSEILPAEKLYVYGHSGQESPEIYVYQDKYNSNFEKTIDNMGRGMNQNYDGPVIETIYEKIRQNTDDNIIFISISDGEPVGVNYGGIAAVSDLKRIIEKCKRDGFVTVGIGMELGLVKEIYNYSCVIQDYENDMIRLVSTLVNTVVKSEFQN